MINAQLCIYLDQCEHVSKNGFKLNLRTSNFQIFLVHNVLSSQTAIYFAAGHYPSALAICLL